MNISRLLSVALVSAGSILAGLGGAACDDRPLKTNDTGTPPDSPYDTGNGGGSGGYYGNGSSSGTAVAECPDELKKCAVTFTYPFNGESTVELRGDYRGPSSWQQGDTMTKTGTSWTVSVNVTPGATVLYKFCIDGCATADKWVPDPNPAIPQVDDGTGGKNSQRTDTTCTETVCDEPPIPPAGVFDWRDATIYFAFVDRFENGDPGNDCNVSNVSGGNDSPGNYQGGDWLGVTNKINDGYFTDLGINTIWLTVPLDNANVAGQGTGGDTNDYSAYHGYWPTNLDAKSPESCFGTAQQLKDLVAAAHAKGLKILFDYAMVHVHETSTAYTQHNDWFWPNSNNGGNCVCGDGCSWDTDYKRCWFAPYLPHWNYTNDAARNASVQSAIDWAKEYGIDGYRLDAIKHVEDSWLTDLRTRLTNEIVPLTDPPQRFYLVGETFDWSNKDFIKSFVNPSARLDGQFDFPARKAIIDQVLMRQGTMNDLANFYASNDYFYGVDAVMSPFLGNHDIGRVIHMAEDTPMWDDYSNGDKANGWSATLPAQPDYDRPYERLGVAFTVLLTQRGAPLIYYGDEIGLAGGGDPGNRKFMHWSGLADRQEALRTKVSTLLAIRAAHPSLRRGLRTSLDAQSDVWLYRMTTTGDETYVIINRGDSDGSSSQLPDGTYTDLLNGGTVNGGTVTVPARGERVLQKQ